MINPLAAVLNVPETDIYANAFLFDSSGGFTGHDKDEPTSRAGGKAKVVATLKSKYGYKKVVMVGDGATDLEVRPDAPRASPWPALLCPRLASPPSSLRTAPAHDGHAPRRGQAREVDGGADAFIGYGGVVERSAVKEGACWFVYDFKDMIAALRT